MNAPDTGSRLAAETVGILTDAPATTDDLQLTIVVPTFNEAANVAEVVRRVGEVLAGERWEIVFVDDDSPDGTAETVRELARRDPRVRCLHRIGRRGLSTACIEGMLASPAPYIAVMDADMQHDERVLKTMLETLRDEDYDVVVGSRYVDDGGTGDWDAARVAKSRAATRLSRFVLSGDLGDPMSGFFMLKREALHETVRDLSGIGFKILLDILSSSKRPLKFKEVPYVFRTRERGESKLDSAVAWDFLMMLCDKKLGHLLPARFISFALIGGFGIGVHFAVLILFYQLIGTSFVVGQAVATVVAMTSNFFMNNFLTYRDMRLKGWGMLRGWVSFCLACGIGAFANVGVAHYLFAQQGIVWALSALAGILVGVVWNYAVTSVFTWKKNAA